MTIETKINFKRYLKLMYILTYRKPLAIIMLIMGFLSLAGAVFSLMGVKMFANASFGPMLFGFLLIIVFPLSVYQAAKKSFYSSARLQEKIIYEFNEDKIKIMGESFASELSWEKTHRIMELKNWVLIYQNNLVANVIPKEAFGDKIGEFRQLARSKGFE